MKSKIQHFLLRFLKALPGFLILLLLYFTGEWIAGFSPVPVPGAVVGMMLMFSLLRFRIIPLAWVETSASWLLLFMGLFYIPYGVGIAESKDLISTWGWQIILLILITVLTVFFATAKIFQTFIKEKRFHDE